MGIAALRRDSKFLRKSPIGPVWESESRVLEPIREPAEERGTGTFCSQGIAK